MLIFLKLGGSLITDKTKSHSERLDTIDRLLTEVKKALIKNPGIQLLIGHGSGSFGHIPAKKYATRSGVYSAEDWIGFTKVFYEARSLNHLFINQMRIAGLVFCCFPPSVLLTTSSREVFLFNLDPLLFSLQNQEIPLIFGDVVFDEKLHGSILSTEELFCWLAPILRPSRILLAGQDEGVFADFPKNKRIIPFISKTQTLGTAIGSSAQVDVTGGMLEKVKLMQKTCILVPGLTASIFSGDTQGNVYRALCGEKIGTLIS